MKITDKEKKFIVKRSRLVRAWPLVGSVLLLFLLGVSIWLFFQKPLLANPFAVLMKLNNEAIPNSTLTVMAGLLPLFVLACTVLTIFIVLFCFASIANEKKYIKMIHRNLDPSDTLRQGDPSDSGTDQKGAPKDTDKTSR